MPRGYKRKTRSYRRTARTKRFTRRSGYKRKYINRRRGHLRVTSKRQSTIFPDSTYIKFKSYSAWEPLTSGASGGESLGIAANNIGDPFGTLSSSLQPTGLDQYAAFYSRFIVTACKVKLEITPDPAATDDMNYIMHPSANAVFNESSYATREPMELPYVSHAICSHLRTTPMYLKKYFTSMKAFGRSPDITTDAGTFSATAITAPTLPWYINIRAFNIYNPAVAMSGRAAIVVTQYVKLFRRVDIADSTQ